MKLATIRLHLTKDHSILKNNITPIEALVLSTEHKVEGKESSVDVIKGTEKELPAYHGNRIEHLMSINTVTKEPQIPLIAVPWTVDNEIIRLRKKYAPHKLAVLRDIRTLPETFDDALKLAAGAVTGASPVGTPPGASPLGSAAETIGKGAVLK